MLSNRYISNTMSEDLLRLYADLESDLIVAYSSKISKESFTAVWLRNRALAVRELRQDLQRIVNKYNPKIVREIEKTLKQTGYKALESDERFYRKAVEKGVLKDIGDIIDSKALENILKQSVKEVVGEFKAMNTTAILTTASRNKINRAMNNILSGALTREQGIRKSVIDLTEKGITGVVFESGKTMGLVEYARMSISTGCMACTRDLVNERMSEYDIDLVAVSSHAGARPKCYPYQGEIYSWSGKSDKYPAISSTSYGEPDGLFGINCRHYYTPYVEEMGKYIEDEVREKENAKIYDLSQEQRYNERQIRKYKREAEGLKSAGLDNSRAKAKVSEWQARQREFIEKNDLTRIYAREKV